MAIIRWPRFAVLATAVAVSSAVLAEPPKTGATTTTAQKPANTSAVTQSTPAKPSRPVAPRLPGNLQPTVQVIPDHPGVHINSVRLQGNCRQSATTFVVEVQNNLTVGSLPGFLVVTASNGARNQVRVPALAPREKQTLTMATPWYVYCENNEVGQPACFEVSIEQDGAVVGASIIFDGVKHRVCENPPNAANPNAPLITDTPHK